MSERIGDYATTSPFTTAGGGQCEWAFAERDGKDYFIKRFLAPKYPTPGSPGNPKTIELKRGRCEAFEHHHRRLMSLLSESAREGSNLITAVEFFRDGTTYYKVTRKVDVATLSLAQIGALEAPKRLFIMISAAHAVQILHRKSIVHGDLKPDNVLIQRNSAGELVGRLIDFDNSFVAHEPPDVDGMVGDMAYYSPELAAYIRDGAREQAAKVGLASDVFALGLVFSAYALGKYPGWSGPQQYAFDAVGDGHRIEAVPEELAALRPLLARMLAADQGERPGINEVVDALKKAKKGGPVVERESPPREGVLRFGKIGSGDPSGKAAEPAPPSGGLRMSKSLSGAPDPDAPDGAKLKIRMKGKPREG